MGNDEPNSNPKKNESPPKKPKKEIKFQNEFLKSKKINSLNKSIIDDLISPPNKQNKENNDNINDINFQGISGGNNSKRNKIEKLTEDLDCLSVDNRLKNQHKFRNVKRFINNRNDTKKMSNKIENEKNIKIGINRNNYETINNPMMSTSKNFYRKKIKYNENDEEDKKEEKKIYKNNNNNKNEEEKASNIKSISENFQINNKNKIDDDLVSENIEHKKIFRSRKRNHQKKYNNVEENYNTINNDNIRNPLIKSQKIEFKREEDKNRKNIYINIEKNLNINNNINIDNKINDNLNINNEVKKNNKNDEDDLDSNLKINNLIESKNSFKKSINVEIKKNQHNEVDNEIPKRRMVKYNSYSDLLLNNKIPKKLFLFDNPNIFDSFLIILNNIIFMTKYFSKNGQKIEEFIKKYDQKQYLFGILYYINKYLWDKRPEEIIQKNKLRLMYKSFMDCYIKKYCKNSTPEFYLYDINNIEMIIHFIFTRINFEQTNDKKDVKLGEIQTSNKQLYNFMKNYLESHKSIISDCFTGFYLTEETCTNCWEKAMRYQNIYNPDRDYSYYNYISFDLKTNNEDYSFNQRARAYSINPIINGNENTFTQFNNLNLNIYSLLDLEFSCFKSSICKVCRINPKQIRKQFYSLPKVLTIILKNNDGSFEINDEINLTKYAHKPGNYNFKLISILCKFSNGTYITYSLNHRDSNWYNYTSEDKIVHKARYLDVNAIPYVLVYQNIEFMDFEYNPINRKEGYLFRFQNGLPQLTLYFEPNSTIKDAIKEIKMNYSDIKNPVLLINGTKLKPMEKLSDISFDMYNKSILVIDKGCY